MISCETQNFKELYPIVHHTPKISFCQSLWIFLLYTKHFYASIETQYFIFLLSGKNPANRAFIFAGIGVGGGIESF